MHSFCYQISIFSSQTCALGLPLFY